MVCGEAMWSIREVADLAGVSPRAVRHYNAVGLLAPPARLHNRQKRYGVEHLARLRQIRRLRDLGLGLAQITALDHSADAVRALDAELAATVNRLQHTRADLASVLRDGTPLDLPPGYVPPGVAAALPAPDRAFVVVMSRVLGPRVRASYADMLRAPGSDPAAADFETLADDAGTPDRRDVAVRMARYVVALRSRFPGLADFHADAPHGRRFAAKTVADAMTELYNPAQVEVLARTAALLR